MDGVDIHFRVVALLREDPARRHGNLIMQGVAWHDGERVELRTEGDDRAFCIIPDELVDQAMPVTGRISTWYPDADYYIVCGDWSPSGDPQAI